MPSGHRRLREELWQPTVTRAPLTCAMPRLSSPTPSKSERRDRDVVPGGQWILSMAPTRPRNHRTETKGQSCTIPVSQSLSSLIHKLPEGQSCTTNTAKPGSAKPSFSGCKHSKGSAGKTAQCGKKPSPRFLKLLLSWGSPVCTAQLPALQQGLGFTCCKEQ